MEKLTLCRRYKQDHVCRECGKDFKAVYFTCNSLLCPSCSKKKWQIRTLKVFEALESFLGIYPRVSMWTFTIPEELREVVWDWGVLVKLRKAAIEIVKEKGKGKAGMAVIQTFSSRNHTEKNPHIHLVSLGQSGEVDYVEIVNAWARVLEKMFEYQADYKKTRNGRLIAKVVVQEGSKKEGRKGGPFLVGGESVKIRKGALFVKVQYELRMAGQHLNKKAKKALECCQGVVLGKGGVFKHYELVLGNKQVYCYWGQVWNYFKGQPIEKMSRIEKGVLLGGLKLSRQQKRRLIRELKKKGENTANLANRVVGELEYEILKGLPLILKKPLKKRYDECKLCGSRLQLLATWDLVHLGFTRMNEDVLLDMVNRFGGYWEEYYEIYQVLSVLDRDMGWELEAIVRLGRLRERVQSGRAYGHLTRVIEEKRKVLSAKSQGGAVA